MQPMKIMIVSPEAVPYAKTGGLADVAGALPKAIAAYGHDVILAMPLYSAVNRHQLVNINVEVLVPCGLFELLRILAYYLNVDHSLSFAVPRS